MQKLSFGAFALLASSLFFVACHDHDHDKIEGFGDVEIEFDNQAGSSALLFGTEYTTASNEKVKFTAFNYYVSNFVLTKADGTEYVVPKDSCYFLCKHDDADSRKVVLKNIPAGDYTGLRFVVGVDSAKSVSPIGERLGVLDPATGANGHYWSWNSGYIFMKMEGISPAAPVEPGSGERIFQYHVGLYGGLNSPTLNNLKTIDLTVPDEAAQVRNDGHSPHFHLYVDALKVFNGPNTVKIADNPYSHGDAFSPKLSANYATMFLIDHVHNH
jgi:hypothetical protein